MIDIENDVFEMIASAVETAFPNAKVHNAYTDQPAAFPCVTVAEADNTVLQRMRTDNIENAASVMYEVNVFSNNGANKKSEAKSIINLIDSTFLSHGFTRSMKMQVPNFADRKIYRIVARYKAVVGHGATNGTFLIYQNDS